MLNYQNNVCMHLFVYTDFLFFFNILLILSFLIFSIVSYKAPKIQKDYVVIIIKITCEHNI